MAAGDFSASNMAGIIVALDDVMADSRVQKRHNLDVPTPVIEFIKAQETATFIPANAKPHCTEFTVTWLQEPDTEATLNINQTYLHRPPCTISGEELESFNKPYKLAKSVVEVVKIKDEDCNNIFDFGSKVQIALLQAQKSLKKRMAKFAAASLLSFAGTNAANGVGFNGNIGEASSGNANLTEIPYENITADEIIPYLTMVAALNGLQNPKLIDGGVIWLDRWRAQIKKGTNAGDVGEGDFYDVFGYNQDLLNFMAADLMNYAFLVDAGTLSMPIRSYFPALGDNNEVVSDKYIYSIPMAGGGFGGEDVRIDVTYTRAEEQLASTGRCQLVHTFHMEVKFDIWQAPKYTTDTVTGVIALKQASAA